MLVQNQNVSKSERSHDSASRHVLGSARYTDDLPIPESTLHIIIGQSSHAHALIKSIDLSSVAKAEGIVAVLSASDIPGVNDCSPVAGDDPIFATDKVSYLGQSVFAVVAESTDLARFCSEPR